MSETVGFRADDELVERIEEQVDAGEASSRSAFARRAVETYLDELAEPRWRDEQLNRAYQGLLEAGADMGGEQVVVDADRALTIVADRTNTPKDAVKNSIMSPLRRQGRIDVVAGRVWVAKPSVFEEAEPA